MNQRQIKFRAWGHGVSQCIVFRIFDRCSHSALLDIPGDFGIQCRGNLSAPLSTNRHTR